MLSGWYFVKIRVYNLIKRAKKSIEYVERGETTILDNVPLDSCQSPSERENCLTFSFAFLFSFFKLCMQTNCQYRLFIRGLFERGGKIEMLNNIQCYTYLFDDFLLVIVILSVRVVLDDIYDLEESDAIYQLYEYVQSREEKNRREKSHAISRYRTEPLRFRLLLFNIRFFSFFIYGKKKGFTRGKEESRFISS